MLLRVAPFQTLFLLHLLVSACAAGGDGRNPAVLQLPTDADAAAGVATRAAVAYTIYPTNGTLLAGQDLMQAERLYSPGGSVFLVPQTDGNLVLYDAYAVEQLGHTAPQAAIWDSGTYFDPGPQPFVLAMQEDCNLVLYNGYAANNRPHNAGDAVFNTATYNQGTPPCSLLVSDAGGGGFVVVDATGAALYSTLRVLALPRIAANETAFMYNIATVSWSSTAILLPDEPAANFAQTRLHDGRVLLAGGFIDSLSQVVQSASLFSPATLTIAATGNMIRSRVFHTLVTSFNGSALSIGGIEYYTGLLSPNNGQVTGVIEAFNPYTGTWAPAGVMSYPRDGHVSIVLANGQVLTTGGYGYDLRVATSSAELFDPVLGVSTVTGLMSAPRVGHSMVLLADGTALACGGLYPSIRFFRPTYLFTCDLYNPGSGLWEPTGNMTVRSLPLAVGGPGFNPWFGFTLSLLPSGRVLASGPPLGPNPAACVQQLNLYDPQTRTWSVPAALPNFLGPQILLPTGELLLANSFTSVAECQNTTDGTQVYPTPELYPATTVLYNPVTGTQKVTGSLPGSVNSTTPTLLDIAQAVLF